MAELKTTANEGDVKAFLESVEDPVQRQESLTLLELMEDASGSPPVMYGTTIVGFGNSTVTYANGSTQEWFSVGFSPRKGKFSLYIVNDAEAQKESLDRLGTYKHGKSCVWVKRLSDIDLDVLKEIVKAESQ